METANLGLSDERWVKLALDFNFDPASYIDPSWIDTMDHKAVVQQMINSGDIEQLSPVFSEAFGLTEKFCDDFSQPFAQLSLITAEDLMAVLLYIGVAIKATDIRSHVMGNKIREIKASIGDDAYEFAVKRVSLIGKVPHFDFDPKAENLQQQLVLIGLMYCLTHLKGSESLVSRLILKLPATWVAQIQSSIDTQMNSEQASEYPVANVIPPFMKKIIREVNPTWLPLFA